MTQATKTILFASDLSVEMKSVFEHAARLAISQNSDMIILHVMEETPHSAKQVRMAFGEELYQSLKSEQRDGARNILSGKNVDALKIRQAMTGFFDSSGKDKDISGNSALVKKIMVAESRSIADEITSTAREEGCHMIVMGCKKQGILAETMGNNVVRKVLKRSSMPVFVVPFSEK